MTEIQYLQRRLGIAEEGLRRVMMVVIQQMPPYAAHNLNDVGRGWDQALDELGAEYATRQPVAHASDKGGE